MVSIVKPGTGEQCSRKLLIGSTNRSRYHRTKKDFFLFGTDRLHLQVHDLECQMS